MITKIDHLGIAVPYLDQAIPYYEKALGLKCEHREEVASQKVRTAFFAVGEVHIELLDQPARIVLSRSFLRKIRRAASITLLRHGRCRKPASSGFRRRREADSRNSFDGAGGKLVAFLHPKSTFGVLTELCMPKPE